jgi:hypothetical protein
MIIAIGGCEFQGFRRESRVCPPSARDGLDAGTDMREANGAARGTLAAFHPRGQNMPDFTPYQQKIIKRYYDHQDTLQLQRLAELVSELYLSSGKKRERVWASVVAAMQKLGIPQKRIDHLRARDNPALIAEVVGELEGKK